MIYIIIQVLMVLVTIIEEEDMLEIKFYDNNCKIEYQYNI